MVNLDKGIESNNRQLHRIKKTTIVVLHISHWRGAKMVFMRKLFKGVTLSLSLPIDLFSETVRPVFLMGSGSFR